MTNYTTFGYRVSRSTEGPKGRVIITTSLGLYRRSMDYDFQKQDVVRLLLEEFQAHISNKRPVAEVGDLGSDWIPVHIPIQATLKLMIWNAMCARGLSKKMDLTRLMGWKQPQGDRLYDFNTPTKLTTLQDVLDKLRITCVVTTNGAL